MSKAREVLGLIEEEILWQSPKYKAEVEELIKDPIIIKMAKEVGSDPAAKKGFLSGEWWAMSAASGRYNEMGGKKAKSIGGPLAAIQKLLQD